MSVRPLIAMYLLILCAVATGCGSSAWPKAETDNGRPAPRGGTHSVEPKGERDAPEHQAAEGEANNEKAPAKKTGEDKAAANGYVKVEVELCGVLTCTEEAATLSIDKEHKWVLDFGEDKEMRAKAKGLDGKKVLVEGSAILQYETQPVTPGLFDRRRNDNMTVSVLDLGPKIVVKRLVAATKE